MRYKVTKGTILHNGNRFRIGDILEADPLQMSALVAEGFVIAVDAADSPSGAGESFDEEAIELPTPDEFARWPASKQKSLLEQAGVAPASNAEGRIEQFVQLYESADEQ